MNRLFLLIPAVGEEENAWQDFAYLRKLGEVDNDVVISILRQIKRSLRLVEEEDFELIYDERYFKSLLHSANQEMPQLENLLVFFNDAVSIQQRGIGNTHTTINGMQVNDGLVNAIVEGGMAGETLFNKDALTKPELPIFVEKENGEQLELSVLPCQDAEVYLWFVENRLPKRMLDPNYEKHGRKVKAGKKGVRVSALTYTEEQLGEFLKRAVVAKKGLRELYFKDNAKNKIVIFWDENLENPSYHAMEVEADDVEEIQKIFKRGGRALSDRIEDSSKLI